MKIRPISSSLLILTWSKYIFCGSGDGHRADDEPGGQAASGAEFAPFPVDADITERPPMPTPANLYQIITEPLLKLYIPALSFQAKGGAAGSESSRVAKSK